MLNAPDGHLCTVAIISSEGAFSILIHGDSLGWNTLERLRTQLPECVHLPDCQITVVPLWVYSLVRLLLSIGAYLKSVII